MSKTQEKPIRTCQIKVGENRGKARVYLQGKWLADAGFTAKSKIRAEQQGAKLTIYLDKDGDRTVSGKKSGASVVDLNYGSLSELGKTGQALELVAVHGRIEITPAKTRRRKASRVATAVAVSLFAGGGLMDVAAAQAGYKTALAIEANEKYADIHQANHPDEHMVAMPIEQVDFGQLRRDWENRIGLLMAGIPCEPYSTIRRLDRGGQKKRDKKLPPEAHELGAMTTWTLFAVDAINPHTCVFENVPKYLESASGYILQNILRAMGYNVDARVVEPYEYGELTNRKRAVIVATTGQEVVWPDKTSLQGPQFMESVLEDPGTPGLEWFSRKEGVTPEGAPVKLKPWLYDHWDKQTAKGNGFQPPVIMPSDTSCVTIKKRYFAGQGDNPVVGHPKDSSIHRWLTLTEVKRLHGLPDDYDLGTSKTTAGEIMGQGVLVGLFKQVFEKLHSVCN